MTALSNMVPFALFDALLSVVIGAWVALAVRDFTGKPRTRHASGRGTRRGRTVVWAAGLYLTFLRRLGPELPAHAARGETSRSMRAR